MSHLPVTGIWRQCPHCQRNVHQLEWGKLQICPHCGYYLRLTASQRIQQLSESFQSLPEITAAPPFAFPGYQAKLAQAQQQTGATEAFNAGVATLNGQSFMLGVMDSHFMMGTLNTIVGARLRQAISAAQTQRLPLVLVIASGGARMQEGILSLLQMNTVLAAFDDLNAAGNFTLNILTDPTMGGVSASFAFAADTVIAEAGATIGFAGKRVIQGTSREPLPPDFQSAASLYQQGQLDAVVKRTDLAAVVVQLLRLHQRK
ncbi:acetyl-CoA carboxylase carboxyltransferase subunit beta [Loigolactobacillus zhaoyuanensis]|uniref:Acetyl-coenzyme A carboxylase carboxyl transferase subunit beta n=1 Tax=Loigolactobacillus zhaoyuanensis TaxID=2486017 RepID=A0ABW8UEM1_9LACO|nr:acetyl-CoA carboxylase carboxyltransferase subunit beta [Loigolactobacillus zhaoyuanensis]